MNATSDTELMHAVLDGEASPAEADTLRRRMAADPAVQAEFEALRTLFEQLAHMPQRHPPEGLVAAVMASVTTPTADGRRGRQLSAGPNVLGSPARNRPSASFPFLHRNTGSQDLSRSIDMSQQTPSSSGSRKIWIGGALAAVAVVVVAQFGFGGKANEKDVIGTIAPAERVRAPQPTAADIKVGPATAAATGQAAATAPAESAQKAAELSAGKAAEKSAEMAAGKAAEMAAGKAAEMAAGKAAEKSAELAAGKAAERAAGKSAEKSAELAAGKAAELSAGKAAEKSAEMAAGKAAEMAAGKAAEKSAEKAAERAAMAAAAKAAEKSAEIAASKAAERGAAAAAQK